MKLDSGWATRPSCFLLLAKPQTYENGSRLLVGRRLQNPVDL